MDLVRLRGRMPVIVFVLLVLVCLALLGFACACLSEQPGLALERVLQSAALPGLLIVWATIVLGGLGVRMPLTVAVAHPGRGSPELLQRFRF